MLQSTGRVDAGPPELSARLLDAALSLEADEDWLRDALPPVSQAVRDSIERCAADVVEAEHFAGTWRAGSN